MYTVFTDLDGTLLHHDTYAWQAARPAIARLEEGGIPWIFVTSKTRAETEHWRRLMGNRHPFVVENGGAAYIPKNYFPFPVPGAVERDEYLALEWGHRYQELRTALRIASEISGVAVRGFGDMSRKEVAELCILPLEMAGLAKQREYGEPFTVQGGRDLQRLVWSIERQGFQYTRGGRFHHIIGSNDKALAVKTLCAFYQWRLGSITTVGIGDGPNDVEFLRAMDVAIVMESPHVKGLRDKIPRSRIANGYGPEGWRDALLSVVTA
jgi:mannosyl-3-phosphoglycerate phosphatase